MTKHQWQIVGAGALALASLTALGADFLPPRPAEPWVDPPPAFVGPMNPPASFVNDVSGHSAMRSACSKVFPFVLTASLEESVPEGPPVMLALALHNSGAKSFLVGWSVSEASSFQITLTDVAGHRVPRTAVGENMLTPPMSIKRLVPMVIDAGQTLRYRFDLAQLFDLSRTGDYTVSVSRALRPQVWPEPTGHAPEPTGHAPEPTITFTLPPLDVQVSSAP